MKKITLLLAIVLSVSLIIGCAQIKKFMNNANTRLTSSSLAAAAALRAQGITIAGTVEGGNYYLTPDSITGKVLSVVLPINGQADEGVTPFGSGRPDIAPANSNLYDFDLTQVTTLANDSITVKPGFNGGESEQTILIFGYFDVQFAHQGTTRTLRFCYGDSDPYVRGDKLLYNASGEATDKYYWYNTSTESFVIETGTRPNYPVINTLVATFEDNVRPDMHYYMLGAINRDCTDYDGATGLDYITLSKTIVYDYNLTFTVDFDFENSVLFADVTSEAAFEALTDAQLIEKFDMKQNVSDWGDTGLYCSISFEVEPKF